MPQPTVPAPALTLQPVEGILCLEGDAALLAAVDGGLVALEVADSPSIELAVCQRDAPAGTRHTLCGTAPLPAGLCAGPAPVRPGAACLTDHDGRGAVLRVEGAASLPVLQQHLPRRVPLQAEVLHVLQQDRVVSWQHHQHLPPCPGPPPRGLDGREEPAPPHGTTAPGPAPRAHDVGAGWAEGAGPAGVEVGAVQPQQHLDVVVTVPLQDERTWLSPLPAPTTAPRCPQGSPGGPCL